MKLSGLKGQSVCILGYGREGQAMKKALKEDAPKVTVTIRDQTDGSDYLQDLDQFDVIIQSPGIPPQPEFEAVKAKMTSATQIFLDEVAGSGAQVIGVTGSKGKSTVASLIAHILKAAGKDVSLIGNIGEPAIAHRNEAKPGKIFVMEMSSYQLMNLVTSPALAVVTSFFPEHLDYHGSEEAYMEAKKHITRFQNPQDTVFFNIESPGAKIIAQSSIGHQVPIAAADSPVSLSDTKLIGKHNLGNIALATAVADYLKIERPVTSDAIRSFTPLPHRLQSLGVHDDIEWVDDSISTTPESAIAALDALGDSVKVLLLGGQDRGNDFSGLADRIAKSKVELVILFPESGTRIRKAIEQKKTKITLQDVQTMEEAIRITIKHCHAERHPELVEGRGATNQKESDFDYAQSDNVAICLLSPASPSYNQYKNFEERGQAFAEASGAA